MHPKPDTPQKVCKTAHITNITITSILMLILTSLFYHSAAAFTVNVTNSMPSDIKLIQIDTKCYNVIKYLDHVSVAPYQTKSGQYNIDVLCPGWGQKANITHQICMQTSDKKKFPTGWILLGYFRSFYKDGNTRFEAKTSAAASGCAILLWRKRQKYLDTVDVSVMPTPVSWCVKTPTSLPPIRSKTKCAN